MPIILNDAEVRVLGALVEKQITTPEYYPLTINALTAACNQKTNREPIVNYDEATVTRAIESLRAKNLVYVFLGSGSRTVKYKHRLPEMYELEPPETAVLAALMLRGAQTLGELRERGGRFYEFADLNEVNQSLENLINLETPLAARLERQLGQKETRFAHLLTGELPEIIQTEREPRIANQAGNERIANLEQEIETLKAQYSELRQIFEDFKKQFE